MSDATNPPETKLVPADALDGPDGDFGGFDATNDADLNDIISAFGGDPIGPTSADPAPTEPVADPATPAAPVAPEPVAQPAPVPPAPATPTPAQPVPPVDPNAAPVVPPADPAAPAQPAPTSAIPPELLIASLQAQLAAATEQLNSREPATPINPSAAGNDDLEAPAHSLTVPQEVVSALFGEDGNMAHKALNHILSGVANYVHQQVRTENLALVDKRLSGLRTELATQSTVSTVQEQQKAQQEEYYAEFPTHKNPVLVPIVAQAAAEVLAEVPGAPWNTTTRAVIGARVNERLAALGFNASTVNPIPPAPTPTPSPAPMLPTAPAAPLGSDEADEILSTFKL